MARLYFISNKKVPLVGPYRGHSPSIFFQHMDYFVLLLTASPVHYLAVPVLFAQFFSPKKWCLLLPAEQNGQQRLYNSTCCPNAEKTVLSATIFLQSSHQSTYSTDILSSTTIFCRLFKQQIRLKPHLGHCVTPLFFLKRAILRSPKKG